MIYKGLVSWAVAGTTFTATGMLTATTSKIQSFDMNSKADTELVKDQNGEVAGFVVYNGTKDISFDAIAFDSGSNGGNLNITLPAIGAVLTVATDLGALSGSFYVTDASIKATNTSAKAYSIKATAYANVSGATS